MMNMRQRLIKTQMRCLKRFETAKNVLLQIGQGLCQSGDSAFQSRRTKVSYEKMWSYLLHVITITDQCVKHICKIIPRSYLACTVWCITMVKLGDNMGLRAQQSRAGVRSSAVQAVEKRWANVLSQCCKIWMIPSPVTSPTNIYVRMRWDLTGRPQSRRPSDPVFNLMWHRAWLPV